MTQMTSGAGLQRSKPRADNDVYTVLVIIGFVVVAATLGFVMYRCNELFGSPFPSFAP